MTLGQQITRAREIAESVATGQEHRYDLEETITELADLLERAQQLLRLADDDIREHLQVARYNLNGMTHTGDQMPVPVEPVLIHQHGIDMSDQVRASIKVFFRGKP